MSYHRYSQRRLRFTEDAPVAPQAARYSSPPQVARYSSPQAARYSSPQAARYSSPQAARYSSPSYTVQSPVRYMPSPRRRRYNDDDNNDDDDDDDETPIPFSLPPPPPLRECIMVTGRADESCFSQECPITLEELTDENAVTFICPAGGNRTAVLCFNMFALLYTLYRDINYFQRPPQLPTNRAPVSDSALRSLYRRVTLMLEDGYAEDPDHPDYEYANALRELISQAL